VRRALYLGLHWRVMQRVDWSSWM